MQKWPIMHKHLTMAYAHCHIKTWRQAGLLCLSEKKNQVILKFEVAWIMGTKSAQIKVEIRPDRKRVVTLATTEPPFGL